MHTDAYSVARQTLVTLLPEVLLLLAATAMMTAGPFVRLSRRTWYGLSVAAVGLALAVLAAQGTVANDPYSAPALGDAFAYSARLLLLFAGLLVLALAHDQVDDRRASEFFGAAVHAGGPAAGQLAGELGLDQEFVAPALGYTQIGFDFGGDWGF